MLGWLIRTLFNIALLIAGTFVVVAVFASLLGGGRSSNAAILINPQAGGGWFTLNQEQRQMQQWLLDRSQIINTPLSADPTPVTLSVASGDTAAGVAGALQSAGLITDANLFAQLLHFNGIDTQLRAGQYLLRRNMSMREIAEVLYRGRFDQRTFTVFAGWRLEEIAQALIINNVMDGQEFYRIAKKGIDVNHPLLNNRPLNESYEGYLFPGTYHLSENPTPQELIGMMASNLARQLPPNAEELARQQGLTLHEAIILASIVQREAALDAERPIIASVYLNRLKPDSPVRLLQADPTVQYAMGYQEATGTWWKSPVSLDEYSQVDNPYNTYLYPGLPPGPISNPSIESIMGVLQPAQTDYRYFVCANPGCAGGNHTFAATYSEHLQNVAVYYGQ